MKFQKPIKGGVISEKSGISSPRAGMAGSVYESAHAAAVPQPGTISAYYIEGGSGLMLPVDYASKTDLQNATGLIYQSNNKTIQQEYK